MGQISDGFADAFRDYVTNNVPSSGEHEPEKSDIRALGAAIERTVSAAVSGLLQFATVAAMNADTTQADGRLAYVYLNNADRGDPANGVYQWNDGANAWQTADWYFESVAAVVQPLVDEANAAAAKIVDNDAPQYSVLSSSDTNRTMLGANDFANDVGAPNPNVSGGKMRLTFAAGANRDAALAGVLVPGETYEIAVDCMWQTGSGGRVTFGEFSGGNSTGLFRATPGTSRSILRERIVATTTYFAIGQIAADAITGNLDVYEVEITRIGSFEKRNGVVAPPKAYGLDYAAQALSRIDRPLTRICVAGDSLVANDTGGNVPVGYGEGAGEYPIRLDCNNIARRLYDALSWNKPTHRQVAHAAWTKSGAWVAVNDTSVWEPPHALSNYHKSTVSGAYLEITVPAGQENFALIVQKSEGFGSLDITLNGGSIAAHGPAAINLARAKTGDASDIGNPYFTVEYLNLPAGPNVIRVAKQANTTEVRVWGGFWWSGNTLMVYNVGHGNHSMAALLSQGHIQAEIVENNFDLIIFELPVMNEVGTAPVKTVPESQASLETILGLLAGKSLFFWTPWPFGTDPVDGAPNYYQLYSAPTMKQTCAGLMSTLYRRGHAYLDIFQIFEEKIISRGGTLLDGPAGYWYTTDGQHPTPLTNALVFAMLMAIFAGKPITQNLAGNAP